MSCLSSWFSHKRPIFAAVLLATVTAGLYPRNYHFRNGARWSEKGAGLEFGEHGAAFTEPFLTDDLAAQCVREGFTLEVALAGAEDGPEGFGFIAHFYAGSERSQLLLGQWRDWLVVMNGDDYAHRRGTPRISMQLSRPSRIAHLVTITSGPAGTRPPGS